MKNFSSEFPIKVTPVPMVMLVADVQLKNALDPTYVTESGMVMSGIFLHPEHALDMIFTVASCIVNEVISVFMALNCIFW